MQIQALQQGSKEWHKARSKEGLCLASQAAAVVNAGKFTPKNQDELLQLKRGEIKIPYTKAMAHGNQFEDEARAWVEKELNLILEPACLTREIDGLTYWASLDGATMDLDVTVEIKCPYKGVDSELWDFTERAAKPPPYYYWQMLHQYLVCPARSYFVVYDAHIKKSLCVSVDFSDVEKIQQLKTGWQTFWQRYRSGEQPAPEFIERTDLKWRDAAHYWRMSKAKLDAAIDQERMAREQLIALAGDKSSRGEGVNVTRCEMKGAIDYKQIPSLAEIDLETYRKAPRVQWRISEIGLD